MRTRTIVLALALVSALATPALRAGEPRPVDDAPQAPRPGTAAAAFEKLKALAGDWVNPKEPGKVAINWKLTAGGSALVETIGPGSDHEMVTVYFMDKDDLVLTHYCGLGNQPRMKAVAPFDGKTLKFEFAGGTNLEKGTYMGGLEMTAEKDQLHELWTLYKDGKPSDSKHAFELERKK